MYDASRAKEKIIIIITMHLYIYKYMHKCFEYEKTSSARSVQDCFDVLRPH